MNFIKGVFSGKRRLFGILLALFVLLIVLAAVFTEKAPEDQGEEERIAQLCSSVDGVGECRVMITLEKDEDGQQTDRVFSVAVLCDGGDNVRVRARLTELITAIYGIGSNRVSIVKLKQNEK